MDADMTCEGSPTQLLTHLFGPQRLPLIQPNPSKRPHSYLQHRVNPEVQCKLIPNSVHEVKKWR